MKTKIIILIASGMVLSSFSLIFNNLPTEQSVLFSGSGNCTACHSGDDGVLIDTGGRDVSPEYHWQSSMMANAAKDPYWQAKVSSEVEENPHLKEVIEDKCVTCHAPMGRTEAIYGGQTYYSLSEVKQDALSLDGISCTVCHQIDPDNLDSGDGFSGNYLIKPDKQMYGPYENPFTVSMINRTGYTPVHGKHIESPQLCASCHTLSTPYVDQDGNVAGYFPEQMPYYEWLNSSYPDQEITCQKCHMPQVHEDFTISSLPPNLQNKRNPVFEHHFVGGNLVLIEMLKDNYAELGVRSNLANLDTTLYYVRKNVKENSVDLLVSTNYADGMASVNVTLKNRTGHKLPTGFPSRRLWIHFIASNEQGDTIFESGGYDLEGNIARKSDLEIHHDTISSEDQVQVYEAVLGNVLDEVTTVLLEASQYLKDNRIPPVGFINDQAYDSLIAITGKARYDVNFNKDSVGNSGTGTDQVTYYFPIDYTELNYSIELCYQSIKPSFANHLSESLTDESISFTQMYSDNNLPKVEVVLELKGKLVPTITKTSEILNWNIYPNPANGLLFINGITEWPASYSLFTLNGTLVSEGELFGPAMPLEGVHVGMYLLQLQSGQDKKSFNLFCQ